MSPARPPAPGHSHEPPHEQPDDEKHDDETHDEHVPRPSHDPPPDRAEPSRDRYPASPGGAAGATTNGHRDGALGGPRSALAFLTVVGGAATPSARALPWFAPVGALVGLAVGVTYAVGLRMSTPWLAAAVAISADLVLTGLLHVDGLADSADGLLPPLDRDRRLDVMRDPATGAFGVATVVMVLLLRVGALAAMPAAPWAIAGLWAMARGCMALTALTVPYARAASASSGPSRGGIASAFGASATPGSVPLGPRAAGVIVGLAGGAALAVVGAGWSGALAALGALTAAGCVMAFARHRIGGFTGDVLGAMGVVAETAGLLLLSIRATS